MTVNTTNGSAIDWKAELLGLAKWWWTEAVRRLSAVLGGDAGTELLATLEGDGIVLAVRTHDGTWTTLGPLTAATAAMVREKRPVLLLRTDRVLRRTLTFPRAAEARLRDVVELDLDRRTPFRADQAYFAVSIIGRPSNGSEIAVEVTVLPRIMVRDAIGALASMGCQPAILELEEPDGQRVRMPLDRTGDRVRMTPMVRRALAVTVAVATGISVAYAVQEWRLRNLQDRVDAVARESAEILAAADRVAKLRSVTFFAVERKRQATSIVVSLEALARLLPDGTWLTEVRFDGDTIQLVGVTNDSARLVPLIEESPHFSEAQYRSALIREGGGLDRFNLVAKAVPHASP